MLRGFLLLLFSVFVFAGCASRGGRICNQIYLREGKLDLSANEKVLVCGTGKGDEGWRDVPIPQAQYQLKVFLQNEGYLNPRFERERDELQVWAGERARVKEFIVNNADGLLHPDKKRQVLGEPITPALLDDVKRWAETALRSQGYACPQVEVHAQAWDGRLIMDVKPGPRQLVDNISYEGLGGLDVQAVARYQAMEPGNMYDVRQTQVTSGRLLSDGLFQTAYFKTTCKNDKVDLALQATIGKPRLLRFGFGGSTEEFPFARIWFKNARLDNRASSFTATLYASPRLQSADMVSEFYRFPWSRRAYLGPRFYFARQHENDYEVLRGKLGGDIGRQWDAWKTRFVGRVGPTLNYVDTVDGIGPERLSFLSWEGSIAAMTHHYELYSRDQYEGWQTMFEYRGQREGAGSPINVDRYELNFKYLWNVGSYAPPLFILASRLQAIGVDTKQISELSENVNALTAAAGDNKRLLPVDYRIFFGGDQNLRGFNRQSLNNGGLGYTTALYLGFELRLIKELPYNLEPFLLFDSAQLGDRRVTLDAPLFTSQGVGLRWPSPFGTLRGSAAKGRILDEDERSREYPQEWVYFLSFGQEF
ncbi:MAG: BamA/TamA family outer membrane protein [Bdellovibrionales bacterium]|nr:BamA/TamA family outer membrane protein [Bdellovibrionales bacterium]